MRLLVITYEYTPHANPRAVRWGAVTRRLAAAGHSVDVICGPGPDLPQTETGPIVHRVDDGLLGRCRRRFSQSARGGSDTHRLEGRQSARRLPRDGETPSVSDAGVLRQLVGVAVRPAVPLLRGLYRQSVRRWQWPDYASGWIAPATRHALHLLGRRPYDALVTVSNPFSSHLVGLAIRRRQPGLRWLADIGDPFARCMNNPHHRSWFHEGRNRRLESRVLESADVVTTVTDSMIDAYARWYPGRTGRMHVVPPILVDPPPSVACDLPAGRRAIVFSGMLFRRLRNPRQMLELFRGLMERPGFEDVDLHFYGNATDCASEFRPVARWLGTRIVLHGEVPHAVVWAALRNAHVLLNLGVDMPYGLPSKLIEYADARRPIVHVGFRRDDPAVPFLERHGAALCLQRSPDADEPALLERFAQFLAAPPDVDAARIDRLLAPHRLDEVAGRYARLLGDRVSSRCA